MLTELTGETRAFVRGRKRRSGPGVPSTRSLPFSLCAWLWCITCCSRANECVRNGRGLQFRIFSSDRRWRIATLILLSLYVSPPFFSLFFLPRRTYPGRHSAAVLSAIKANVRRRDSAICISVAKRKRGSVRGETEKKEELVEIRKKREEKEK